MDEIRGKIMDWDESLKKKKFKKIQNHLFIISSRIRRYT